MARADYAHWNEDADRIWWEEEGRHAEELRDTWEDDLDREADSLDAFAEDVAEWPNDQILDHLADAEYCRRWPKAVSILRDEMEYRTGERTPSL